MTVSARSLLLVDYFYLEFLHSNLLCTYEHVNLHSYECDVYLNRSGRIPGDDSVYERFRSLRSDIHCAVARVILGFPGQTMLPNQPLHTPPLLFSRKHAVFAVKGVFALGLVWLIGENVTCRDSVQLKDGTTGYLQNRANGEFHVQIALNSVVTVKVNEVDSIKLGLYSSIQQLDFGAWIMVLLVPMCASVLFWLRWHTLLKWNGASVERSWSGSTWIWSQIAGILPTGSLGADACRVYAVRAVFSSVSTPIGIVMIERITGLIALIAIGMAGSCFHDVAIGALDVAVLLPSVFVALGVVGVGVIAARWCLAPSAWGRLRTIIRPLVTTVQSPRRLLGTLAISLLGQTASILVFVVIDRCMDWDTPLPFYLIVIPAITLTQMLPFHIAGLGVAELGLWYFFGQWTTRSASDAVLIANVARLATWASLALMGFTFWLSRMGSSNSRACCHRAATAGKYWETARG